LNHTDEELEFLARLIDQRTTWQIVGRKGSEDGSGKMTYGAAANLSTARTDLAPAVLAVRLYDPTPRSHLDPLATKSSQPLRAAGPKGAAATPDGVV
jgi:hypothetical protein